jgi:hypothetical protein
VPISFDPEAYKAVFDGEITYSKLLPAQNDPSREVWNMHIAVLKESNGQLVAQQAAAACGIQGCQEMAIHRHNFFYENTRPGSPIAKFITDLKDKGNTVITEAQQLEGKRFRFIEEKVKGGMNPQTGQQGKDRTYFYVIGPVGSPVIDEDEPVAAPVMAAPTNNQVTAPVTVAATPNGATDLTAKLIDISDGKTVEEIRVAVKNETEIYDNKPFLIKILSGQIFVELKEKQLLVEDNEKRFHKVG